MAKLSKKANVDIISFVLAIDPNQSKLTSYDEAWDIISEYGGITGNLYTGKNKKQSKTRFDLIKESNESVIYTFEWNNKDVFCEGDWNWTKIFKDVLDYVIKNKIVKKPRAKRSDAGKPKKPSQISTQIPKMNKLSSQTKNSVKSQENNVKSNSTSKPKRKQIKKQ